MLRHAAVCVLPTVWVVDKPCSAVDALLVALDIWRVQCYCAGLRHLQGRPPGGPRAWVATSPRAGMQGPMAHAKPVSGQVKPCTYVMACHVVGVLVY